MGLIARLCCSLSAGGEIKGWRRDGADRGTEGTTPTPTAEALTQVPALNPALSQREREQQPLGGASGQLYARIRSVLIEARAQAWRAVNAAMVAAYWEIGRVIVEEEQRGAERAGYGDELLAGLAERLTAEFGRGFDRTNLHRMRLFFLGYPIRDALRHELSWTHYRILLKVEKPDARSFYEQEAVAARWLSGRQRGGRHRPHRVACQLRSANQPDAPARERNVVTV